MSKRKVVETPNEFLDGWGGVELPPTFHAYAMRLHSAYLDAIDECSNAQELADALVEARKEILKLRDDVTRLSKPPPCQHTRQTGWFNGSEYAMRCDGCGANMGLQQATATSFRIPGPWAPPGDSHDP